MNKTEITQLTDKAFDEFWDIIAKRFPEAKTGDLSPDSTIRLQIAAEKAVKEWIANNVPRSPDERNEQAGKISALMSYLDSHSFPLKDFGCFVALSEDRRVVFTCPMMADGTAEQDENDPRHMHWSEVTAPEPEFVHKMNELFGILLLPEDFAAR